MVLIFYSLSIFRRNENRFISLVLKAKEHRQLCCHNTFSLNFIVINSPINFCYISSFFWFMKLKFIHVESSFHVISYLNMKVVSIYYLPLFYNNRTTIICITIEICSSLLEFIYSLWYFVVLFRNLKIVISEAATRGVLKIAWWNLQSKSLKKTYERNNFSKALPYNFTKKWSFSLLFFKGFEWRLQNTYITEQLFLICCCLHFLYIHYYFWVHYYFVF